MLAGSRGRKARGGAPGSGTFYMTTAFITVVVGESWWWDGGRLRWVGGCGYREVEGDSGGGGGGHGMDGASLNEGGRADISRGGRGLLVAARPRWEDAGGDTK